MIHFSYCYSEIKSLLFKSHFGKIYCGHLGADYSEYHCEHDGLALFVYYSGSTIITALVPCLGTLERPLLAKA